MSQRHDKGPHASSKGTRAIDEGTVRTARARQGSWRVFTAIEEDLVGRNSLGESGVQVHTCLPTTASHYRLQSVRIVCLRLLTYGVCDTLTKFDGLLVW